MRQPPKRESVKKMNEEKRKNLFCLNPACGMSLKDFSETQFIFSFLSSAAAFLFTFSAAGKSKTRPVGQKNTNRNTFPPLARICNPCLSPQG